MSEARIEKQDGAIRVLTPWWEIEHSAEAGGAWSSIVFKHGSRKNLLRRPVSSSIKFGYADPSSDGRWVLFCESNEKKPALRVEQTADGFPVVVAEGTYRDAKGKGIPVGFRRRTEYRDYGLVWTTLEIMSDTGCDEAVEVRALDLALRRGMTDAWIRPHPAVIGGDLIGGAAWHDLTDRKPVPFMSKHAPLQMLCFERGVEGIELFPSSELAQWDVALKPELGLGLYYLAQDKEGTTIELNPYCLAYRRVRLKLKGNYIFRLGIGLPAIKPRETTHSTVFHASAGSRWPSDADIADMADAGVKLIRFHNDYREDGPFWHDGMYPPYDATGMKELKRVIETAHKHRMKIVPYISLKEFHPESPGYAENSQRWMHMAAPSVGIIHTWARSGEFGGLMCLKSGWLDFRKKSVDTILSDLPWDGLYFDWTTPHPCCHPAHAKGPYHNDVDEFLDFLFYCRKRVGKDGYLFLHLSGTPSLIAENLSDLVFINEDFYGGGEVPEPGQHPAQCDFIPIVQRHLIAAAKPGTKEARGTIMGGFLQGFPPNTHMPVDGFGVDVLEEIRLFKGLDLTAYEFHRATDKFVKAGKGVHAAAWTKPDGAVLYLANFSNKEQGGAAKLPNAKKLFGNTAELACEQRMHGQPSAAATSLKASELATGGLRYRLAPWKSCVFVLTKT
jgi:hypothetical protein